MVRTSGSGAVFVSWCRGNLVILISIGILLLTPLLILVFRFVQGLIPLTRRITSTQGTPFTDRYFQIRTSFSSYWLIILTGILTSWLLVLFSRPRIAYTLPLGTWRPATYFHDSPIILVDLISWSFALALTSLVLVVILTSPMRLQGINWRAWASSLALAGFGLLAVMAGNPLTLMLAWAAIDVLEIIILFVQVREHNVHLQAMITFVARVGGLGLLVWANVVANSNGNPLTFSNIPPGLSLILLIACGLRLGVFPFYIPYTQEPQIRRGLGTTLRFVPAAASLVLLARSASAGVPEAWVSYLLVLVGLSALYSAVLWFFASDELNGRPFWISGVTAFAVASGICSMPEASLSWGLVCIFSGGLLFLYSPRVLHLLPLPLFGLIGILGLPFTPAWKGIWLFTSPSMGWLAPVFILAHALLAAGYILHSLRPQPRLDNGQSWVWLIYLLGLTILPIMEFTWFYQFISSTEERSTLLTIRNLSHLPLLVWLGGALSLILSLFLVRIRLRYRFKHSIHSALFYKIVTMIQKFLSLGWLYDLVGVSIRFSIRIARLLTNVLEGDGGILWVMVLLALAVALIIGRGVL